MKLTECKVDGIAVSQLTMSNGALTAVIALMAKGAPVGSMHYVVYPDEEVLDALTALNTAIEKQAGNTIGSVSGPGAGKEEAPLLFDNGNEV